MGLIILAQSNPMLNENEGIDVLIGIDTADYIEEEGVRRGWQ